MFLKDSGFLADTEIGQRNAKTVAQVLCLMREREEFKVNRTPGAYTLETALQVMSTPPLAITTLSEVVETSPIDLLQLGHVGRSHPAATAQILKLCNSSIFCLPHPVSNLEQAVVSLGAEVLRTLGLAWGVVESAGKYLPPAQARSFWQHGLTVALLSERIAERMDYPVAEAYLAGFLHDVGRIPMLIANPPEKQNSAIGLTSAVESPESELREFSIDHCELGRRIGISWGFSEPFMEVFGGHHGGDETSEASELVRIVSAAERFCSRQALAAGSEEFFNACLPGLEIAESMSLAEVLEFEFLQAAQRLNLGASKNFSPALRG